MLSGSGPVLMVIEQASSFHARQASGLGEVLSRSGVPLLVHLWGSGISPPSSLVRLLHHRPPAAVVIAPLRWRGSERELAEVLGGRPGLPTLWLGGTGPGGRIRPDNALGMRLVARHLVEECDARKVLVVRGLPHQPDSCEREGAVRAELARLGVPAPDVQVVTGGFERARSFRVVRAALERFPDTDTVIALNDRSALGAVDAVVASGRRVPDDVVVTGFDDEDFAEFSRPPLTTVHQDARRQAECAAAMLLELLDGQDPGEVAVEVQLIRRESTARQPRRQDAPDQPAGSDEPGTGPTAPAPGPWGRAELGLWDRVAGLETMLTVNRSFLSCQGVDDICRRLADALPRLGVARCFLVLHSEDKPEPAAEWGALVLRYADGVAEVSTDPEPFDLGRLLPERLHAQLESGTLTVHPLESEAGELGYLLLDRGRADIQVEEALRVDLARAIETVRGTERLKARTRQLEAEAASRRAAWEAMVHQANHDPLTGLMNRSAFLARTEDELADAQSSGALILLGLRRFRDVNDALGHEVGDAVLCEIARRLMQLVGAGALVGRLAGDEFAVFVPGARDRQRTVVLAQRILDVLLERADIGGLSVEIDGRVGVACAPLHARDAASLMRVADIALHTAGLEQAGIAVFDPGQQEQVSRRLALFGELRRALANDEMTVYYQPIVTVATGEVSGVEALVRWQHPTRGLLLPGEFIDVAEQTGLIDPLTTYVLDRALGDCRIWRDQGTSLKVAVNLSVRRLTDVSLPAEIDRLLSRHQVPASSLALEITESAAMSDPERALVVLRRLRDLGTELSVDDFGTGHASLTYLTRLPVTALKIDRSFVQPMESDAATESIVRSILHLASDLGLDVIAEGVETSSAFRRLDAFGCDQAQGFWLARPSPAEAVPAMVAEIRRRLATLSDSADRVPRQRPGAGESYPVRR